MEIYASLSMVRYGCLAIEESTSHGHISSRRLAAFFLWLFDAVRVEKEKGKSKDSTIRTRVRCCKRREAKKSMNSLATSSGVVCSGEGLMLFCWETSFLLSHSEGEGAGPEMDELRWSRGTVEPSKDGILLPCTLGNCVFVDDGMCGAFSGRCFEGS